MNKKRLRLHYGRLAGAMESRKRAAADEKIKSRLFSLPEFRDARWIMTYLSIPGEADTLGFAREALALGKRLAAPGLSAEKGRMEALELESLDEGLIKNRFGIPEPDPEKSRPVQPEAMDLHVVPGLSFDLAGRRLGRGGGYYDRFLARISGEAFIVGVCYELQIAGRLPQDEWDVRAHCVVTEKAVYRV